MKALKNYVDTSCPTVLSLCSGIGMLDEAVKLVFPGARTACLCEWEAYAASVLLARMEDKSMEPAPVWCGDLRDFDARQFCGVVDILIAGLPCQPYSVAGKKEGNTDERSWGDGNGPIPNFLRIVSECQPAVVFLENVAQWVRGGHFKPVGEELCRLGYKIVEPVFIAAEDVGASHQRKRVFLLAYLPGERGRRWKLPEADKWDNATDVDGQSGGVGVPAREFERGEQRCDLGAGSQADQERKTDHHEPDGSSSELAESLGQRLQGRIGSGETDEKRQSSGHVAECDSEVSVSNNNKHDRSRETRDGRLEFADSRIFAPGPNSQDWGRILAKESDQHQWHRTDANAPHIAPAIEPDLRLLVDGMAYILDESRADQLRCVGNGVVALQAAVALVELLRRTRRI